MQALQDPQARFTDLRGNTSKSAAVGAGQFVNMIEAAQRMGVDVNKQLFDLPFQHKMMVFYAKEAGIDFTKKLTREEWNTVGSIWASISQKLGQSTNTADQTYQFYLDDLSRRGID
jgi:muramidase (phage lysozyme)